MIPRGLLQQLHNFDTALPQFHEQLIDFLCGDEYRNVFPSLQSEELTWLVGYLDHLLPGIPDPTSLVFQQTLRELSNICGIKGLLPGSCTVLEYPLYTALLSASGCVYKGTLDNVGVRIRCIRMHPNSDTRRIKEAFHQVAVVWKHLAHPKIVPLLGVTTDPPQLISGWMYDQDLVGYIANNPGADKLNLLSDVAEGLNHLHSCNVIHGDLKGSNVLVDAAGNARITDPGLAMITHDLDSIRNSLDEYDHSALWIAPEILVNRGTYSKEADVFSFAMVIIEVFTGDVPFCDKPTYGAVLAIVSGDRPLRPTHPEFTDGLWMLTQQCWHQETFHRPQALHIMRGLIPVWKRLINRPLSTNERIALIADIFSDCDDTEMVKRLRGNDAQSFIDVVDEMLDSLTPRLRKKCLKALYKVCGRQALLPRSLQIPPHYDRSVAPSYRGGYADVWIGEHQGRKVAVKVLRFYSTSKLGKIVNRFCREVVTWKTLRHPNILPLMGVTMGDNCFAMVSEWMTNGSINEFTKAHRDVNRFELLGDVARGLIYMHGEGMVHGDLKGVNILIDRDGHARLADFGLLTIVSDPTHPTTTTSSEGVGTLRWMSPELFDPERFGAKNSRPSKESDCYALGMVILEVLTGQPPFAGHASAVVVRKVGNGERPERPQGPKSVWFTDDLWEVLGKCWSPQPKDRPQAEIVLDYLKRGSVFWQPLSPDIVMADSSDEQWSSLASHSPGGDPWSHSARRFSPEEKQSEKPAILYSHLSASTPRYQKDDSHFQGIIDKPIDSVTGVINNDRPVFHDVNNLAATSRSNFASHRQHVSSLNECHTRPNSVVNQRNGFQSSDKFSLSLPSLKSPLVTSSHPIFHNVKDLAAYHDILTFLPPTPRTSSLDETTPSSENDAFSRLRSEYMAMLDNPSSEWSLNPATYLPTSSDEEAAQAILSIHRAGDSSKQSEFLTSPMESPFDEFLSTPGLRNDEFGPDFTSPLIADGDDFTHFHDTPLFDDGGLFEPPSSSDKRASAPSFPAVSLDSMYAISPVTPALDNPPLFWPIHKERIAKC